jgi:hypothetical protein
MIETIRERTKEYRDGHSGRAERGRKPTRGNDIKAEADAY